LQPVKEIIAYDDSELSHLRDPSDEDKESSESECDFDYHIL
jgi:hypothetical protein